MTSPGLGSTLLARFVRELPDEGIYAIDAQGTIVTWNAGAAQVSGYSADEAVGRHISFLYPPDDVSLGRPTREMAQAERDGRSDSEGWRLRRDGERIWVSSTMLALREADGRVLGFCRSDRDTTEQLRAEQALRFSEAKFSGIIGISTDAIVSTDEEQRIILFNRGAEEVFGYATSEVLGQPLEILIPQESRAAHPQHVASFGRGSQAARAMGRHRSEIHGLRKDGSRFPAEASISKLDVEGRRIYTAVLRDVTERHETERRIADLLAREQEAHAEAEAAGERARFLAEAGSVLSSSLDYQTTLGTLATLVVPRVADGCAIHMLEGDELRLIEVVHPELSAHDRDTLLTRPKPAEDHPAWVAVRSGRGDIAVLDRSVRRSPDTLEGRWIALGAHSIMRAPICTASGVIGVVGFSATSPARHFSDEDLRLAEELGRRAGLAIENARLYQEARRASQARDDMLHAVSHDLGNSLGAVMVSTAVLLRTLPPDAPAAARDRVTGIRALAEQMQRLRQDLLDAAAVESGRLSIDPEVQEPRGFLDAAAEQFLLLAEERGLTLRVEQEECGPVYADAGRVQQVLGNLVGNALKFTPAGGTVSLGCEPHAEGARFWVADTGSGISAEDLPHVFDRFWRTRESNRLGTGLGLAIARGIVDAHGGRIWVESERGVGTTFSFVLPRERPMDA